MARVPQRSMSLSEEFQRLNLCIPSTLLQCYDSYRTQLLQPLCLQSMPLNRTLNALNSIRSVPETSFHDLFNPLAWVKQIAAETEPTGTAITVPPLAIHVANAMKSSTSILHQLIDQDTDRLRAALSWLSDEHLRLLGSIAKAGFTDTAVFDGRDDTLRYIAANCSSSVESLILNTSELLTLAPYRKVRMPDMVAAAKRTILETSQKYSVPFQPYELECYTGSEIEEYAKDDLAFYLSGKVRHCGICGTCHEALTNRKIELHAPSEVSRIVDSYENRRGGEQADPEDEFRHFGSTLPC